MVPAIEIVCERVEQMAPVIEQMGPSLSSSAIIEEVRDLRVNRLDPWTPSRATLERSPEFKFQLITTHSPVPFANSCVCMITGLVFAKQNVVAAHVWKFATGGKGLEDLGLSRDIVDTVANGFLCIKAVEKCFDIKDICFFF